MYCYTNLAALRIPLTIPHSDRDQERISTSWELGNLSVHISPWVRPWFCRTHCCYVCVLMSYIKTKYGMMWLFPSTIFRYHFMILRNWYWKMQWIAEAESLFFKWKRLQVQWYTSWCSPEVLHCCEYLACIWQLQCSFCCRSQSNSHTKSVLSRVLLLLHLFDLSNHANSGDQKAYLSEVC